MMPRIFGTLMSMQLDYRSASSALTDELADILRAGTKAWVQTVVDIVPTWSGMSQASIKPIADLVDVPVFSTPVAHTDRTGRVRYAPDRRAEGERQGSAQLSVTPPRFFFRWQTAVEHLLFNEKFNANLYGFHLRQPGPYGFRRKASTAFFNTVNPRLRRLRFDSKNHIRLRPRNFG